MLNFDGDGHGDVTCKESFSDTCVSKMNVVAFSEHKHKRQCRLSFVCFGRGEHCLYPQNFFSFKTRNPRSWIHIMFLAVQARSQRAVCQQDPSVGNLKACWDTLKLDSGNSFVRLVTSSFPSARVRAHSQRAKAKTRAKIFFNVSKFFFDLFRRFFELFRFCVRFRSV